MRRPEAMTDNRPRIERVCSMSKQSSFPDRIFRLPQATLLTLESLAAVRRLALWVIDFSTGVKPQQPGSSLCNFHYAERVLRVLWRLFLSSPLTTRTEPRGLPVTLVTVTILRSSAPNTIMWRDHDAAKSIMPPSQRHPFIETCCPFQIQHCTLQDRQACRTEWLSC